MAQNKTKKSSDFIEIVILAFALVTSAMIIAEVGGNVSNELATRQSRQTSIVGPAEPAPAPTLLPEEYEQLMQNTR